MGNIEMRVLAICHNTIYLVCKIHTPITFGLGVKMHHDHGSRELIDDLSSLGHSIPYDEVRRFLTVVALDQLTSIYHATFLSMILRSHKLEETPCIPRTNKKR